MTDPHKNSTQPTNDLNNGTSNTTITSIPDYLNDSIVTLEQAPSTPLNNIEPRSYIPLLLISSLFTILGLITNIPLISLAGAIIILLAVSRILIPRIQSLLNQLNHQIKQQAIAIIALIISLHTLLLYLGVYEAIWYSWRNVSWDAVGALAEGLGAIGQIAIAIIAVYVAWVQYYVSKDLTIQQNALTKQQNTITQQQTIDAYFEGISNLVLNQEGMLEDWPQERLLAEGRTAAILNSIDGTGKAKVLRFLSSAKLLTPLRRDSRLGRPIFDGLGGYAEDRTQGIRVIDLGNILTKANLIGTDLRQTDLTDANLFSANLSETNLVKANLSRTILYQANFTKANFKNTRLFYGSKDTATPRPHNETDSPNYRTGEHTGAVIENANFTNIENLSEEQRYYCCCWGGEITRTTIPGGCEGIPNKLGR